MNIYISQQSRIFALWGLFRQLLLPASKPPTTFRTRRRWSIIGNNNNIIIIGLILMMMGLMMLMWMMTVVLVVLAVVGGLPLRVFTLRHRHIRQTSSHRRPPPRRVLVLELLSFKIQPTMSHAKCKHLNNNNCRLIRGSTKFRGKDKESSFSMVVFGLMMKFKSI